MKKKAPEICVDPESFGTLMVSGSLLLLISPVRLGAEMLIFDSRVLKDILFGGLAPSCTINNFEFVFFFIYYRRTN